MLFLLFISWFKNVKIFTSFLKLSSKAEDIVSNTWYITTNINFVTSEPTFTEIIHEIIFPALQDVIPKQKIPNQAEISLQPRYQRAIGFADQDTHKSRFQFPCYLKTFKRPSKSWIEEIT